MSYEKECDECVSIDEDRTFGTALLGCGRIKISFKNPCIGEQAGEAIVFMVLGRRAVIGLIADLSEHLAQIEGVNSPQED